jgi:hypothetical protein
MKSNALFAVVTMGVRRPFAMPIHPTTIRLDALSVCAVAG